MPCDSYTYTDWGACSSDGFQARSITSKAPAGCVGEESAVLKQSCNNILCKSHAYSDWSECDSSGKQKRRVILSTPQGCAGGVGPVLEQACDQNKSKKCEYSYSNWGSCELTGKQNRKIISVSPENCVPENNPVLEQACVYSALPAVVEGSASGGLRTPCDYSYSAWGACVSKRQTRMLVSAAPVDCEAVVTPVLERECGESTTALPAIAAGSPAPDPTSMLSPAPKTDLNFNDRTGSQWQEYYFSAPYCHDENSCGGAADPDNDNLNNNDEYRFGTNPKSPDTDRDGMVDGEEIQKGRNPLVADSATVSDAVVYESPKSKGQEAGEIYQVSGVDYDANNKKLKITGKALPDSYVTVYIYSEEPVISTVKTDADGNWIYIVDKPADGTHQVYVVVNENSGEVVAKSAPLPFVQTAEAASVIYPAKAAAPAKTRMEEGYLVFLFVGLGGLILALAAIGLSKKIIDHKKEQ